MLTLATSMRSLKLKASNLDFCWIQCQFNFPILTPPDSTKTEEYTTDHTLSHYDMSS